MEQHGCAKKNEAFRHSEGHHGIEKEKRMGTRNITRVIYMQQIIVNQYCQWNGYPTGHGLKVLEFAKKYCCDKDKLYDFKDRILKSCLLVAKGGRYTVVGAPINKKLEALDELKHSNKFTSWEDLIMNGVVFKRDVRDYLSASRDTGSEILDWLMMYEPEGMPFYATDYDYQMGMELDWQIEGMYTINLDVDLVTINWHGAIRTFTFSKLKNLSETDIKAEMEAFENEENSRNE